MRTFLTAFAIVLTAGLYSGFAQPGFDIRIEQVSFPQLPAVQSYAYARYDGHWLILGGRVDGLHKRMPFAAFSPEDNNDHIFLIDSDEKQIWQQPLTTLPAGLLEQLQSTNMEFVQDEDELYLIGGYAYSPSVEDHITFPYLVRVDVPGLMEAIKEGEEIVPFFQQIEDERMAVTGGQLELLNGYFYLVGGQRFDGLYNPHGADHGPGFNQQYTNEIRKFRVIEADDELAITDYSAIHDETNLHRRDYNMVPQIFPDGRPGFTAFSGVFQHNADLPFLNSVDIFENEYTVNNDFTHYLSHYHSSRVPLYDEESNQMHTIFLGGISQFFIDQNGNLTEDQDVPFVRTISVVTRNGDGSMNEVKLPVEMPALLGAGAEFILAGEVPVYESGIIRLDELPLNEPVLVGYVLGGIESTLPNVFWEADGLSQASNYLLAVYLTRSPLNAITSPLNGKNPMELGLFPNPATGEVKVKFTILQKGDVYFTIQNTEGKIVDEMEGSADEAGSYDANLDVSHLSAGLYFISVSDGKYMKTKKVVLR